MSSFSTRQTVFLQTLESIFSAPKMPEIPPDVITVILSLLPVKSLLRFRCVSKPWCSEIDSPDFINLHLRRNIENKSNLSIILHNKTSESIESVDFDKLDESITVETPFPVGYVFGSCNGLILVKGCGINVDRVALYNPTTRKHMVIPPCPVFSSYTFIVNARAVHFGFGYDSVNDDYKILCIVEFVDVKTKKWVGSDAKIYSLNSNKWKPIKDFPYELPWTKELNVHVGGAFHILVNRNRVSRWPDVILVTDIVKEDYRFMELPGFVQNGVARMSLNVLGVGESLCLLVVYGDFRTELWVMKEYGVMNSWIRLLSVAPPNLPVQMTLETLLYSKDLSKILFCCDFCWFDLKSNTLSGIPVRGLPQEDFCVNVCVASLVPPHGYRKPKKQQKKNAIEGNKTKKKRDDFLSKGFKLKL